MLKYLILLGFVTLHSVSSNDSMIVNCNAIEIIIQYKDFTDVRFVSRIHYNAKESADEIVDTCERVGI